MKTTYLASAVAASLLLPLTWGTATAAVATTASASVTGSSGSDASVATLEGQLSPAAAELLAAGRSRSPPIAESRGKAAEYRRVGAAAPVPPVAQSHGKAAEYGRAGAAAPVPPHLPASLAAEVQERADARAGGRGRAAKAKRAKGAAAAKKAARKAAKARLPRGVDRDAVSREVAAKAAALPIDADVEATMHEVRSAMDRIVPGAKAAVAAGAAKAAGGAPKRGAASAAVKAAAKVAAATAAAADDDRAALRERLAALEVAVLKVNKERDELRLLQSYAAEENRQLTIKLHEVQLALQSASRASGAANPALSRWLSAKELDLSAFVAGTAYEYYTRHSYGPLTAALISYGVLLGPLAASGLFFLRHAKALTLSGTGADLLTGVQAMSVFDAAFAVGLVAAIFVARLGDPLLALRDIAPPLFVFLFLAVAAQTVATVAAVGVYFRRAGGVRGHGRVAWALAIKLVVAADFFGRIGAPALLGRPYIAPVPIGVYLAYVAASSVSLGLVHRSRRALVRSEAP